MADVLSIYSGGSLSIQGGSGGGASLVPVSTHTETTGTFVVNGSNVNQYGDFTTGGSVSVTVTVGSSGRLLIGLGCNSAGSTQSGTCYLSAALSGANTLTAAQVQSSGAAIWSYGSLSAPYVYTMISLSGLAPGVTTVALRNKNSWNGQTVTFYSRDLMAIPL